MSSGAHKTITVPVPHLVELEQCRMRLVRDIAEVRLALGALGEGADGVQREAFLHLVEGRLESIERRVEEALGRLPQWLLRQA